ncbi:hypothetical protein BH10PLA1_BH10PLA1_17820 [soil metagenome]
MRSSVLLATIAVSLAVGCVSSGIEPARQAQINHENAANHYRIEHQYDKALKEYNAAIATPGVIDWWLQDVYLSRGNMLIDMGEFDRGLADVEKYDQIANSKSSRASLKSARSRASVDRLGKARAAYNAEPKNIDRMIDLALVLGDVGRYNDKAESARREAHDLLDQALAKDWNSVRALIARAQIVIDSAATREQGQVAWHNAEKAVDLAPDNPMAHYVYGRMLLDLSSSEHAAREFSRAIELDPKMTKAYIGRCYALLEKESQTPPETLKLVLVDCDVWLAAEPNNFKGNMIRGDANRYLHNDAAAIAAYYRAIEIDPFDPDPYGWIGRILYKRDRNTPHVTESLPWFDAAIKTGRADPVFYYNRALSRDHEGWYLAAMEDWNKVHELDKSFEEPDFSHSHEIFVAHCAQMDVIHARQNARAAAEAAEDEGARRRAAEAEAKAAAAATPAPETKDDWATQLSNALKGYSPDQSAIQAGNANQAAGAELQQRMDNERRSNEAMRNIEHNTTGR